MLLPIIHLSNRLGIVAIRSADDDIYKVIIKILDFYVKFAAEEPESIKTPVYFDSIITSLNFYMHSELFIGDKVLTKKWLWTLKDNYYVIEQLKKINKHLDPELTYPELPHILMNDNCEENKITLNLFNSEISQTILFSDLHDSKKMFNLIFEFLKLKVNQWLINYPVGQDEISQQKKRTIDKYIGEFLKFSVSSILGCTIVLADLKLSPEQHRDKMTEIQYIISAGFLKLAIDPIFILSQEKKLYEFSKDVNKKMKFLDDQLSNEVEPLMDDGLPTIIEETQQADSASPMNPSAEMSSSNPHSQSFFKGEYSLFEKSPLDVVIL